MVNEWTSNDVPSVESLDLYNKRPDLDICGKRFGAAVAFGAMVKHLNAHYPKPETGLLSGAADCVLESAERVKVARADADRWRRAYEIVEGERDLARERLRGETDFDLFTVRDQLKQCRGERERMTRERDEWRARAEAAEARPAVTRDEVEQAIRGKVWAANREPNKAGFHRVHVDWATDAIHALVAGDDPAVLVVRESDVAAVEVTRDSHGDWFADGEHVYVDDARQADHLANEYMTKAVRRFAVARAIEAEAVVDPVEQKAAGWAAAVGIGWGHAEPEDVDLLMKVAAHVLGQEIGDE